MAQVTKKPETPGKAAVGKVSQVIGAVVDVEFPAGQLPNLLDAAVVTTREDPPRRVVLEVQQEVGDNTVRCIAMDSTDGFRRGDPVEATGLPIQAPGGVETLGRMFNVMGPAMDAEPNPPDARAGPINRPAPPT